MEPDEQVKSIIDVVNDGINPEWGGTWDKSRYTAGVDPASGPDETVIGVWDGNVLVRMFDIPSWFEELYRLQDAKNKAINEELEYWRTRVAIGYIRANGDRLVFPLIPRLNSYQRRRARKPWLYEGRKRP